MVSSPAFRRCCTGSGFLYLLFRTKLRRCAGQSQRFVHLLRLVCLSGHPGRRGEVRRHQQRLHRVDAPAELRPVPVSLSGYLRRGSVCGKARTAAGSGNLPAEPCSGFRERLSAGGGHLKAAVLPVGGDGHRERGRERVKITMKNQTVTFHPWKQG